MRDSTTTERQAVNKPAMALIVASSLTIGLLLFAMVIDIWLLASGIAGNLRQPVGISKETQIMIRMALTVLFLIWNLVILIGAVRMKDLQQYGFAKGACIMAMVPCIGPCFIIGLPLGIWGLTTLNNPNVRDAFQS